MPKLLIFDAFTLLIPEKTVANYALLRCKTFSLKIWVCKIFDKFHVCTVDDFYAYYDWILLLVTLYMRILCTFSSPNNIANAGAHWYSNKTIGDEGITVDFWIIKVHSSN